MKGRGHRMKKYIKTALVCTILFTILIPVHFVSAANLSISEKTKEKTKENTKEEQEYIGKVVSKEKAEGNTLIENAKGKELKVRDSGKLYNGYKAYTEDGYLWIALDKNGVIKMDMDTEVVVKKTGKKLEVILKEGEVFFNISEKFAEDEKFTIRTSTMTTGIRGTSGAVINEVQNDGSTLELVQLFDGKLWITSSNNDEESETIAGQLKAGQQYSHLTSEEGSENSERKLEDLTAAMVGGAAADEIRKSDELQARIGEEVDGINDETLAEIIGLADQKLSIEKTDRAETVKNKNAKLNATIQKLEQLAKLEENNVEAAVTNTNTNTNTNTDANADIEPTVEPQAIVIAYYYYGEDGTTLHQFAMQDAMSDTAPVKPALQPTASGNWVVADGTVYDFATVLSEDTSLIWRISE